MVLYQRNRKILHWCDWIYLYMTGSSLLLWHHEVDANGCINLICSAVQAWLDRECQTKRQVFETVGIRCTPLGYTMEQLINS